MPTSSFTLESSAVISTQLNSTAIKEKVSREAHKPSTITQPRHQHQFGANGPRTGVYTQNTSMQAGTRIYGGGKKFLQSQTRANAFIFWKTVMETQPWIQTAACWSDRNIKNNRKNSTIFYPEPQATFGLSRGESEYKVRKGTARCRQIDADKCGLARRLNATILTFLCSHPPISNLSGSAWLVPGELGGSGPSRRITTVSPATPGHARLLVSCLCPASFSYLCQLSAWTSTLWIMLGENNSNIQSQSPSWSKKGRS